MATAVLDIGKTLAKITLWDDNGIMLARETRANQIIEREGLRYLDVDGIDQWLGETLALLSQQHLIESIFPVGHGAAAVIIGSDLSFESPLDYEQDYSADLRAEYDKRRDCFSSTGSPALPFGLNLGIQLYSAFKNRSDYWADATILPWPQFWAWRLSGVMANEVTSMGCHTDLWCPKSGEPSDLARKLDLASKFAPTYGAADVLGSVTPEWVARCGLRATTKVYCGIHDSNAALIAARAFPEIIGEESTVLSTGTWFIAMRSPEIADMVDINALPEARDCLVNIDAFGKPVPSARFMGGREIEAQIKIDTRRVDIKPDQPDLVATVPSIIAKGQMLLPTLAEGTGPFPNSASIWINKPDDWYSLRAAVCLYAALVTDQSLDLIGSKDRLLVEGRFAEAQVFVRALASLRPDTIVYVANAHNDVAFGALRLINPSLQPNGQLMKVEPLEADLVAYKLNWHAAINQQKAAA